ncbi:MAG: FkbM family methyltransferase [Magnetococcales bacterium]|uniref:FkbM family methyltransferase n=1 Tax=Candidatus Magnetobacterium casense TaxID=1455061 RepID=A0ABS6RUE9_9BACT|nr:FkbM family methyltransferase [Candidatus Magnetobacterium casensis]MBF0608641.1 FkbM family methyltransferase [Nitrospirota bacterium]MBV6340264.1 FkbM family methyltransferase [Candidatus Magnetobacterium casensis]
MESVQKIETNASEDELNQAVFLLHHDDGMLRMERDNRNMKAIMDSILRNDSNCIDVGAHAGEVLDWIVQRAPAGEHYAFEPLPRFIPQLKNRFPRVKIHQCALSNSVGTSKFCHFVNIPGWSGLKPQPCPIDPVSEQIDVEVNMLDNIIPQALPIRLIKIDVEGGEYGVIDGAKKTIRQWQPYIIFEHAKVHAFGYGTTPQMLYDLITDECGLAVFSLDGSGPHSKDTFVAKYEEAFTTRYRKHTETNFLARPIE